MQGRSDGDSGYGKVGTSQQEQKSPRNNTMNKEVDDSPEVTMVTRVQCAPSVRRYDDEMSDDAEFVFFGSDGEQTLWEQSWSWTSMDQVRNYAASTSESGANATSTAPSHVGNLITRLIAAARISTPLEGLEPATTVRSTNVGPHDDITSWGVFLSRDDVCGKDSLDEPLGHRDDVCGKYILDEPLGHRDDVNMLEIVSSIGRNSTPPPSSPSEQNRSHCHEVRDTSP